MSSRLFRKRPAALLVAGSGLVAVTALFPQDPLFRSETHVVEVAVIAKDARERPVADLQKTDLSLLDNGVPQTILTLEKVTAPPPLASVDSPAPELPAAKRPARPPARRLTLILLDGLNTELKDQLVGAQQISQMLQELPQGNDAIALYSLGDELRVLHNFTTDYSSLRGNLENYFGEKPLIGKETPAMTGPMPMGRGQVPAQEPNKFEEERQLLTSEAFREISRRLGGISGEKNLLWVTAGFQPPKDWVRLYRALGDLATAKVRIYPIDARGLFTCLPPCPELLTIDSMEEVAKQTGGHAYHDTNALSAVSRLAVDDSRLGYVLTYVPNNYHPDGDLHKIQLRSVRPGVDLRYRPGYVAERAKK